MSLFILLPAVRGTGLWIPLLVRFGRFALASSAIVMLSGTLQAVLEVGSWGGLIESAYGQLVLIKIGLLLVMLVLAVFNQTRRSRLSSSSDADDQTPQLRRGVRAELVVGVVVLAVAAMLSGTPPNRGPLL
jgi:copper transport protein